MILMKLISTIFVCYVVLALQYTEEKKCFSETISSYINKLQKNIFLDSRKINSQKSFQIKPLYDFTLDIFKSKLYKLHFPSEVQNHILILANKINSFNQQNLKFSAQNFLEKYSKNLETEQDYLDLMTVLKDRYIETSISKSEMKIISSLLNFDYQLIYLLSLNVSENTCLPADFNYLVNLNKYCIDKQDFYTDNLNIPNAYYYNEQYQFSNLAGEENPDTCNIVSGVNYDIEKLTEEKASSESILTPASDYTFALSDEGVILGDIYSNSEGVVVESLRIKNEYSRDSEKINSTLLKKNFISNSTDTDNKLKNKNNTKIKYRSKAKSSTKENELMEFISSPCSRNIFNLKDFIIDDTDYEYNINDLISHDERISFYFILSESPEIITDTKTENYVFLDTYKNMFYSITKVENNNQENFIFLHTIQVYDKSFTFNHISNCEENLHVFLTIDNSFEQLKVIISARFTKSTDSNFSKIFIIDLKDIKNNNKNIGGYNLDDGDNFTNENNRQSLYLIFNNRFVNSISLFKNFNFSYLEQISIIYKINQILKYTQKHHLHNVQLQNILNNEIIIFQNLNYEFEDKAYNFDRIFNNNKKDRLHKLNSKFIKVDHCFYSSEENFEINKIYNLCGYTNKNFQCLKCKQHRRLFEYKCYDECPVNSYFSVADNKCLKCPENCNFCSERECIRCKKSYFLNMKDKVCMDYCPIDTILEKKEKGNYICKSCKENCSSCDSSLKCLKCKGNTFLFEGECLTKCPDNYLINYENKRCDKKDKSNIEKSLSINKVCEKGYYLIDDIYCVKQCSDGYTDKDKKCVLCEKPNECKKCSNLNLNYCETCYDNHFGYDGRCYYNCPKSFFKADNTCKKCSNGCEICSNENTCEKCLKGYYYKNGLCVQECGENFSIDKYKASCKRCFDSQCSECSTEYENLCLSCKKGFKLFENHCFAQCPTNFYDSNGVCLKCQQRCISCENRNKCIKCDISKNKFLLDGNCVSECPVGFYKDFNEGKCKECEDKNCLICKQDLKNKNICIIPKLGTIIEGKYYQECPENMIPAIIKTKIVSQGSKNEQIYDILKCFKCPNNCESCEYNPLNEKIVCIKCKNDQDLKDGVCLDRICPDNKIKKGNDCIQCYDKNAKKCEEVDVKISIECKEGFYLDEERNICLSECQEGKYYSKIFRKCRSCNSNCLSCSNYDKCLKCQSGFFLIENNSCVKRCPEGYSEKIVNFNEDYENAFCEKCAQNCSKCDSDSGNCVKCFSPYLNHLGKCVLRCQEGFYENKDKKTCEKCDDCKSLKCRDDGKESIECKFDLILQNGKCVEKCDEKSGFKKIGKRCEKCLVPNCQECKKNDITICKRCIDKFYLTPENKCDTNCPEKHYINPLNNSCARCPSFCFLCENGEACIKCESDKVLFENRCVFNCPKNLRKIYDPEKKNYTCTQCPINCNECDTNGKCLKCETGLFLNEKTNECLDKCPLETFKNTQLNACQKCSENCLECESGDKCIKCNHQFTLTSDNKCFRRCPSNSVVIQNQCVKCQSNDPKCIRCSESNIKNCTKCNEGYFLSNDKCKIICPDGFFRNDKNECQRCKGDCDNKKCPVGFYEIDNQCLKCADNNCLVCSPAENGNSCITCKKGKKKLFGKCYDECPEDYFENNGVCKICSKNCKKCEKLNEDPNSKETKCLECQEGFTLESNICISKCGEGRYENKVDGKCHLCNDENCLICLDENTCKRCNKETYLFIKENDSICLENCPNGYFKSKKKNTCEKCQENCKICSDTENCLKCEVGFYLYGNKCYSKCPISYGNMYGKCDKCFDPFCLECSDNDISRCNVCRENKFLYKDKCIDPKDCYLHSSYPDYNLKKCLPCEPKCKRCKDFNSCLECHPEFNSIEKSQFFNLKKKFQYLNANSDAPENYYKCENHCPDKKVIDLETGNCVCCKDPLCKECSNKGGNCISCNPEASLLDSVCYLKCPSSYFKDTQLGKCRRCSNACKNCESKKKCDKCLSGYYLTEEGNCVKNCPDTYFTDEESKSCIKCDSSCEVCKDLKKGICELCAFGYFKHKNRCILKNECPVGTFANYELRQCSICKITNCLACSNNKICNKCRENYIVSLETSQCINNGKNITLIENPNLYSKYQIEMNNTFRNQTFTGDLRVTCQDSKTITLVFWSRFITDNIKNNAIIFEIKNWFYESYLRSNKTIKYDPLKYSDPGFYFSLKIKRIEEEDNVKYINKNIVTNVTSILASRKNDRNKAHAEINKLQKIFRFQQNVDETYEYIAKKIKYICVTEIKFVEKDYSVKEFYLENEYCSFLMLKEWTMFKISFNVKSLNKANYTFSVFDSTLGYPIENNLEISENFYYLKELNIVSHNSYILINENYIESPIFELGTLKIFEKLLTHNEIQAIEDQKPQTCDINCAECTKDKCIKCRDNKFNKDGYCTPTFIPISKSLMGLSKPQSYIIHKLNEEIIYKYISSDRYTFLTYFYISNANILMDKSELLIFKAYYYNNINLFEVYLLKSKEIKIVINGKYEKIHAVKIEPKSWYGLNISVKRDQIIILMINEDNSEIIHVYQNLDVNQYTLRLTHDLEFYFYGGTAAESQAINDMTISDTRIYINNVFPKIPHFHCSKHCIKCNENKECVTCDTGFVFSLGNTKKCVLNHNLTPIYNIRRKSLYDFEGMVLSLPDNIRFKSFTCSIWMKKNIPSKSGSYASLVSLFNTKNYKIFPILVQEVSMEDITTFRINLSQIKNNSTDATILKILRKKSLDKYKSTFEKIQQKIILANFTNRKAIKEEISELTEYLNQTAKAPATDESEDIYKFYNNEMTNFEYSLNYRNTTFNYIHFGVNVKFRHETNEYFLTFCMVDSTANVRFETKILVDSNILEDFQIYIGDKLHSNINMIYGPIYYYRGNIIKEIDLYNNLLNSTMPKECDAGCKECDYSTGQCYICGSEKITSKDCNPVLFGFTKSINVLQTAEELKEKKKSRLISNRKKGLNSAIYSWKDLNKLMEHRLHQDNNNNYNETEYDLTRKNIQKDNDFSASLTEFYQGDINSKFYSVMGWIYLIEYPSKAKQNIIFRLSNSDFGNRLKEKSKNSNDFDNGLNLITLILKYVDSNPQLVFLLADGEKDREIFTEYQPGIKKWFFFYSGRNTTGFTFEYSLSSTGLNSEINVVQMNYIAQPLQEISSLKLFGVDSILTENFEIAKAVAYHLYLIPNLKDSTNIVKDFQMKVNPTKPNVFKSCDNYSCLDCILDICIKCKEGFELFNDHCVLGERNERFQIFITQNSIAENTNEPSYETNNNVVANPNTNIRDAKSGTIPNLQYKNNYAFDVNQGIISKGTFTIQFYIRRNYYSRSIIYENILKDSTKEILEKNREIISFGNLNIQYLNSLNNGRLKFSVNSPTFNNKSNSTEYILYTSDDISDYQWFFVNIFFDKSKVKIQATQFNKENGDLNKIVINHNEEIQTTNFDKIYVNNLNQEFTIYGLTIFQADKFSEKNVLLYPNIDCPIDCTFCDVYPNNICLKCDYGNQCSLNDSKNNLCKFRFVSMTSFFFESNPDQKIDNNNIFNKRLSLLKKKNSNKSKALLKAFQSETKIIYDFDYNNYVKLSSLYGILHNKIIRFRSFTLLMTASIDVECSFGSIVKILNYIPDKNLSTKEEYKFMDLSFDTIQKTFTFKYTNKNILRTSDNYLIEYNLERYKNRNYLNQYHYIAISYNDDQKLFNFVILNSKDNYIVDNLTIRGNMDYLGAYTHFVFASDFKSSNAGNYCQTKVFDIQFMHENALNTIELIEKLQKNYDYNYIHGCKLIDLTNNQCKICAEGLQSVKGICHYKQIKYIEVKKALKVIENQHLRPKNILLKYDKKDKIESFTIQFMFLKIQTFDGLSGIIKFSKISKKNIEIIKSMSESTAANRTKLIYEENDRDILEFMEKDNSYIFIFYPYSNKKEFYYFYVDNVYKVGQSYAWIFMTLNVNVNLKLISLTLYNYKTFEITTRKFDYKKEFDIKEKDKSYNLFDKTDDQIYSFGFDFNNETMNIDSENHNIIYNEKAENRIKYKISNIFFFTDKALEENEIKAIIPSRPYVCVCGCPCTNDICPMHCRFDDLWVKFKEEDNHRNNTLFQNFFEILESNLKESKKYKKYIDSHANDNDNKALINPDENLDFMVGDDEDKNKDYDFFGVNNYFKKASISFKIDMKKYIQILNKLYTELINLPSIKHQIFENINYAQKSYIELEKTKENGYYNFFKNKQTKDFLFQFEKAKEIRDFNKLISSEIKNKKNITIEYGISPLNINKLFCLTDDENTAKLNINQVIDEKNINSAILTLYLGKIGSLFVAVGGGQISNDKIFQQELDLQVENSLERTESTEVIDIEQIHVYLNIDMTNNLLKVIILMNDLRKDFEFKFVHKTDYIAYFSSLYVHPCVEHLIINVGEVSISQHLRKMGEVYKMLNFKTKLCDDCKYCFVGNKKYLKYCMECNHGKAIFNNVCISKMNFSPRLSSLPSINKKKIDRIIYRRNNPDSTNSNENKMKKKHLG